MKIKTKLRLGFGFLFIIVLFFGAISLFYISNISLSSRLILKDNYESLKYTRDLRAVLDETTLPFSEKVATDISRQLMLLKSNITEEGEDKAVASLYHAIRRLGVPAAEDLSQQSSLKDVYRQLRVIDELNMKAIMRKNETSRMDVERAARNLIIIASICFLILFSFSVNFPGFVANPLKEFSDAIKEISRKNYRQHLEFPGNNEFSELAGEFNTMVFQLNKWESSNMARLQSEKLRIEAIIEQMQDAIIGLNEEKEILFINRVAGQLLNLNEKDAIGKDANDLLKTNDLLNRILQVRNSDKPIKIYADGKESYFQLERREITVPMDEQRPDDVIRASSKTAGEVYILKNITQYKELDEAKTNFIATVSHELKTPISSIKMSLKLMADERIGVLNPEQQELIQHIREDCGRLLKITGELLDLAQVETGNLQLNFIKADPKTIALYAIDAVAFQAEQKAIELELISRSDLPAVYVDTEKTAWVLVNFLSNALRYSAPMSKVLIQILQKGKEVEFSVRDFGKGIDERYQKRLFDRYFQVPTDGNNKSGSGLGLAISKDFIEAEGGKIWVESAIGEGSKFCFSLPIEAH
ncbi:MAG: ATP-binding protein [Arcticibacter sp.]